MVGHRCVIAASLSGCAASELQYTMRSPDGVWEVRTYHDNPGAMVFAWGHVDPILIGDESSRELWHGPPLSAEPVWLNNTTVLVGAQDLGIDDEAFSKPRSTSTSSLRRRWSRSAD